MASRRADEVLRDIERVAKRRFLPIVGPERGRILIDIIRKLKPRRILEVGTLIGYSSILMGKELEDEAEIITIEIDRDEAELAKENVRKAGLEARIKVFVGDALEVIPKLDGEFDMVFLDAAKDEYLECLRLVEGRLLKGGVVVADNAGIFAHSMRDYLDYVRNSGKYGSQFISIGWDGVEVSVRL